MLNNVKHCKIKFNKGGLFVATKKNSTVIGVRVSNEERALFTAFCEKNDITISQLLRRGAKAYIRANTKIKPKQN